MNEFFGNGLLQLPWWGYGLVMLGFTQFTIAAVTLYLHRSQTHYAVEFHSLVSHPFRLWLWLTTGMVTKEWVAIHRWHHAKCESADDPHSPLVYGIWRVLFGGVFLYVKASHDRTAIEKYGVGTPSDWLEHNVYSRFAFLGPVLMGLIDVLLFDFGPGLLILMVQLVWIPFWAAGVINGAGHYWGYQNFTQGTVFTNVYNSRNLWRWAFWIGGEELHNNHHAYPTSPKFSQKPWEVDIGWFYIRVLKLLGLATPRPMI